MCLPAIFLPLFGGAARGQTTRTVIDYTGSLMGYYRMEYGEADQHHLPPVQSFLDYRKPDSNRLLLGMGDNFGPEFGASLQLENGAKPGDTPCYLEPKPTPTHETRPESLYKDDDRVAPRADCDNVLDFLMHAGFRAVVPGTQDFMYTARWLRVSALLLSEAGGSDQKMQINNRDNQTQLLGANLRISMKGEGGGQKGGARCPLLFSQNPLAAGVRCVGDGTQPEPLDWLDRLDRLSRAGGQNTISELQELTKSTMQVAAGQSALDEIIRDEISILQSAWGPRLSPLPPDKDDPKKETDANQRISDVAGKGALSAEAAGKVGVILDQLSLADSKDHPADPADIKDFQTYRDRLKDILTNLSKRLRKQDLGNCRQEQSTGGCFLLSPDARAGAINGLLRTVALEEKGIGYTVAQSETGGKVLIIGVVGADTMNAVSATNLRMCPSPKGDSQHPIIITPTTAFGSCGDRTKAEMAGYGDSVIVSDPVSVTQALVRGAMLLEKKFDSVIVMAQMPHPEAEILSERVWKQLTLAYPSPPAPLAVPSPVPRYVDVVISEAESGFGTQELTLCYPPSVQAKQPAPVVTPDPSYSSQDGSYPGAVSRLTIDSAADQGLSMTNQHDGVFTPPKASASQTTVSLLYQLIKDLPGIKGSPGAAPVAPDAGMDLMSKQRTEFALLEELQKASQYKVDVVLLQSRDVELDAIGQGYTDYAMCKAEPKLEKIDNSKPKVDSYDLCRLRVALDRIFWKGDYLEYVAVTGKDLKSLLTASQKLMAQQAQLADTGPTGEWLISYGIVQSALTNVTEINQNNEPVWIPFDPSCKEQSESQTTYCIGGTPIAEDAYYWLLTTDQLAEDKAIYGTLANLPPLNHKETNRFVTAPLSRFIQKYPSAFVSLAAAPPSSQSTGAQAPSAAAQAPSTATRPPYTGTPAPSNASQSSEALIAKENERFQQAQLWQVDFAKLVASFTSRQPVGGNIYVANFQGVSEPRAQAPSQQELDLELASRVTGSFFGTLGQGKSFTSLSLGEQSAFAYDRAVIGNLSPQTKAINASYSLNSFTEGAFLQVRVGGGKGADTVRSVRSLPRWLLVFTPHQYQIGIDNPYLFFPFATSSAVPGELTVKLPRISGWTDRAGFRGEFGENSSKKFFQGGSYFETGFEFSIQDSNLASLTLQTGSKQKTCPVLAYVTLQTCFSSSTYGTPASPLVINSTTTIVGSPAVKTLHSPGFYWTFHFQNRLWSGAKGTGGGGPPKQISLATDSTGDYYFGRPTSAELPTQTEYAIPFSVALVLPSVGNLSFAPTYSAFFYQPQMTSQSLKVNSFSIAARWYFARDARVPIRTQSPLAGPPSADQTHTGKGH
jgi:hypothetical protein